MRLFLDFDGVLVDSNGIKSDAFRQIATKYFGEDAGSFLVTYHLANSGLSRFDLFAKLWDEFGSESEQFSYDALEEFSEVCLGLYGSVPRASEDTIEALAAFEPIILSAAPREEIIVLLAMFGWTETFDNRVMGSPGSKSELLKTAFPGSSMEVPSLLVGDSRSDFLVSQEFNMGFVFTSQWANWRPSAADQANFVANLTSVSDLLSSPSLLEMLGK